MEANICRLTLVYPPDGEATLIEVLHTAQPPVSGFTTWRGVGHGFGFENASHAEQVAGHVARAVLTIVLSRARAETLLDDIRRAAPLPHLLYWMEPVLAAGKLA